MASRGGGESVSDCHRRGRRPSCRSPAPGAAGRDPGREGGGGEHAGAASEPKFGPGGSGRNPESAGLAAGTCWAREEATPRGGRLPSLGPVPAAGRKACGDRGTPVAESRWQCGSPPSHALLQQILPSCCFCPPSLAKHWDGPALCLQIPQCPAGVRSRNSL